MATLKAACCNRLTLAIFVSLAGLVAWSLPGAGVAQAATACSSSSTTSTEFNFNGTPITAGHVIWFNAVFNVSGLPSSGGTVEFVNQSITGVPGVGGTVTPPNTYITFSPSATSASLTFSTSENAWVETIPTGTGGNYFAGGIPVVDTSGTSGGGTPVWQGTFESSTPGLSLKWQWAAATYDSGFPSTPSGYNAIGVSAYDGEVGGDHAGTPENEKGLKDGGGAAGGGGSNYTGSYSGTASFTPCGFPPAFYLGYVDSYTPRANPGVYPSPWQGDVNPSGNGQDVIFEGCNVNPSACPPGPTPGSLQYDGGAIRIDNPVGAAPLTFTGGQVAIGPATSGPYAGITCVYTPWQGLNVTVPGGDTLILTQTGGPDPCGQAIGHQILADPANYNFDTSESANLMPADDNDIGPTPVCVDDGLIPVVTLDINGGTTTIDDTNQILNDGGKDLGGDPCGDQNEAHQWSAATPVTPDSGLAALNQQIQSPGFVSNSGFESQLSQDVTQVEQSYDQGNTNSACSQLDQFAQQLFQQSAGNNAEIAPAHAGTLLSSANAIANQIGCTGTTASQQSVETSLLGAITTVAGLSPTPSQGTSNQLEQGFSKTGQDLSQGNSNNNQNACQDLSQQDQQIGQDNSQLTSSQVSSLESLTNGFRSQLGC